MSRIEMDWSGPEPVAVYNGRLWYPVLHWQDELGWDEETLATIKVSKYLMITLSSRRCPLETAFNAIEYDQEHGEHPQWAEVTEIKPFTFRLAEPQVSLVWDNDGIHVEEAE